MWRNLLTSENNQRRQRVLHPRRHTAVRQVQVAQDVHESVRRYPELPVGRLQPVATQVLPAHQLDRLQQPKLTSAVHSLQQSAVQ